MVLKKKLPDDLIEIIRAETGSLRYGYSEGSKDTDIFILSIDQQFTVTDAVNHVDYFVWSCSAIKNDWGHPILIGCLTGNCTGNHRLCRFLREHKQEIMYSVPTRTARVGLSCVADGERYEFLSANKTGLRTAMILSHMAEERDDPFLLSDEEKAVLIRSRTGDVPPEERADIYRRTICPANLDKLRRMPENTKVRDELFALLDEICKEDAI